MTDIRMTGASGGFDGTWLHEEDSFATRIAYRVEERLHHEKSRFQDIAVYRSAFFGKILTLDDFVMFTEQDEFVYHEMLTHVPLVTIPEPKDVLVIGGGDCGIAREALLHAPVRRIVQCDIDERVTEVTAAHFDWVGPTRRDPRVELVFDDGVRYVEEHEGAFDLVVVDSTDPIGPAVGLFQKSFYEKVAKALRPGGVMVAQTESPHWGAGLVGAIYGEIRGAFRNVHAYMGYIPTYPSGAWCWAYASNHRTPFDHRDAARAETIARTSRYYHPDLNDAAFALPMFARRAVAGENPFQALDRANEAAAKRRRRSE